MTLNSLYLRSIRNLTISDLVNQSSLGAEGRDSVWMSQLEEENNNNDTFVNQFSYNQDVK